MSVDNNTGEEEHKHYNYSCKTDTITMDKLFKNNQHLRG